MNNSDRFVTATVRGYLRPKAARRIAPIIISAPPIIVTNPTEIRSPPNAVIGPHGPKPDAKLSTNAAMPTPNDITPYIAKLFRPIFLSSESAF